MSNDQLLFIHPRRDEPKQLEPLALSAPEAQMTLNVLGDLRACPGELAAGSFQLSADDPLFADGVTRFAVEAWLKIHTVREWQVIVEWMLEADGAPLIDWEDEEAGQQWLELMGFGD